MEPSCSIHQTACIALPIRYRARYKRPVSIEGWGGNSQKEVACAKKRLQRFTSATWFL